MRARLYSLIAALSLTVASFAPATKPAPLMSNKADQQANLSPEVRLRKLHLVRPDLIPYPIELDIYC